MKLIIKISVFAFIWSLSFQGQAITLPEDEYGFKWSVVDELMTDENTLDQVLHELKMGDTLRVDDTNLYNQVRANDLASAWNGFKKKMGIDAAGVGTLIYETERADSTYDSIKRDLEWYESYENNLKEAVAKERREICGDDPKCYDEKFGGCSSADCIDPDDISNDERNRLYNERKINGYARDDYKEMREDELEEVEPKTWESVKNKIRESVGETNLGNAEYANGQDFVSELFYSPVNAPDYVKTKDEAFDHYYYSFQKLMDDNPKEYQEKLKNLSGYDANLKDLDMTSSTHRDFLAAVAAAAASEKFAADAGGLGDTKTVE